MRYGIAAAVAAAVLAACGAGETGGPGTLPGPPATGPSATGSATGSGTPSSRAARALTVRTPHGVLALPADPAELERRLKAMPARVGDGRKKPYREGVAFYAAGAAEFGIEAAEVEDVTRGGAGTTKDAFDLLRKQLTGETSCATPPARCLTGASEGQQALVWGHDDGAFLLVALAPDRATLAALLRAWVATR